MRDPYWAAIHEALEANGRQDQLRYAASPRPLGPGDLAIVSQGSRLRYLFYDFLESQGYTLTRKEKRYFEDIKQTVLCAEPYFRPCVILERHGPGSYVVCFLASFNSAQTEFAGFVKAAGIPFGESEKDGLRVYPPYTGRMIIGLPVVRSNLVRLYRAGVSPMLAYGELERLRRLVREKVAVRRVPLHTIPD
ncbi:hypothetical protein DFH09DRAFT_1119633 [Mycena vulgaris]|nr:hypothetical protein DFH09DRAFT_1119633 [Mycena vulgaris]